MIVTPRSWDPVAEEYVRRFADELDHKPLDRALLAAFAEQVDRRGRVLDLGCGPGHVAGHLRRAHGLDVGGLDLSPAMIEQARRLHPDASFAVGDLCELAPQELAGVVAFYAVCNLAPADIPRAARSIAGALAPGGLALAAFHCGHDGPEHVHTADLWGTPVDLDFWFHPSERVAAALESAGLVLEASLVRRAYPEEYPSRRAYLLARKPA
ncbi:MAG: class I SAM-dependent methyltransferase [Myxococcales bacterium]|nr:class I SAM-dependent methyltransferase [Myxococcales bacterium]